MAANPSNFRGWSESKDLNWINVTVELHPNHDQEVRFNLAGMQDLVAKATVNGFRPDLVTWAEGYMTDFYEQMADEDEDMGERYAALTPVQRRQFIQEEARNLARGLENAVEMHGFHPIPDLREE